MTSGPGTDAAETVRRATKSRWGVFASAAFTVILIASAVSTIGDAMFDTGSSWLMTSLSPDAFMVSMVQLAITLPMFLLTLPAGALADIVDARNLLIVVQVFVAMVAFGFAAAIWLNWHTPALLLSATFLLGVGGALAAPAWQLIAPKLVPPDELGEAIAVNNASYNLSRAIGPAIGGVAIAAFGVDFPFWANALSFIGIVAALVWWRPPPHDAGTLPAERLLSAVRSGLRYARYSPAVDATLIRTLAFFPFGCAYSALLPLVARQQLHNGPEIYGALMGVIGVGSICASYGLARVKDRFDANQLYSIGVIGTAAATAMFGAAHGPALAFAASVVGGGASVMVITVLFMSMQMSLPEWVRGRGLAVFLTVYFGALTVGSALWGEVASLFGVPISLYASAVCALVGMIATWPWKLQTTSTQDLTPSLHWNKPAFHDQLSGRRGPVLITIEYQIDPKDRESFLELIQEIGRERRRDGAFAWNVFESPADEGRIIETALLATYLEYEYARARVTKADRIIQEQAQTFLKAPPRVEFLVAAKRLRKPWTRFRAEKTA
jgi:MFS family permease